MGEPATKMPVKTDRPSAATRTDDWTPIESLRREVERLFDDFHPFGWNMPAPRSFFGADWRGPRRDDPWTVAPAMDVVEKDGEFEISAELPGIDEKDLDIKLTDRTLTIKGEKSEKKEEKQKDYVLSERRFGSFQRSFQLPDTVDAARIEASFAKGVLNVKLPKSADARKAEKKIEVKAA